MEKIRYKKELDRFINQIPIELFNDTIEIGVADEFYKNLCIEMKRKVKKYKGFKIKVVY